MDPDWFSPRFRSEEYRARFGVGPGDLLVTYIGRIAREKNLELLLDAWETLAPVRGGAQLVLVGRGPLEDEIRRREIAAVHVTGLLQGHELSAAYASADLFTFPSPTETFGNSLLEAMGSGLPSLVAASGGVLEFSEHGDNAWLVAPDSVEAIEEGLERLFTDSALRRRLTQGALRTARERDWDRVYDRLVADYRGCRRREEADPRRLGVIGGGAGRSPPRSPRSSGSSGSRPTRSAPPHPTAPPTPAAPHPRRRWPR